MTSREILTEKDFLNANDVALILGVGVYTARERIKACKNDTAPTGRCTTTDFIKFYGLNPKDYGRQ